MSYEETLARFEKAFGSAHPVKDSMCEASNVVGLFRELPAIVNRDDYRSVKLEELKETRPRDGTQRLFTIPELAKRFDTSISKSVLDRAGFVITEDGYCICYQSAHVRKALKIMRKPIILFPTKDQRVLIIQGHAKDGFIIGYIIIAPTILDPKILEAELQVKK